MATAEAAGPLVTRGRGTRFRVAERRWRLTGTLVVGIVAIMLLEGVPGAMAAVPSVAIPASAIEPSPAAGENSTAAADLAAARASLADGDGPAAGPATCTNGSAVQNGSCASELKWESVMSPGPRLGPAMAYDAVDQYVVLFGGYNGSAYLGDTWEFFHNNWVELTPPDSPSPRDNTTMAWDAADGYLVLFGGYDGNVLGDTWTFVGGLWHQLSPTTNPSPRQGATMSYDGTTAQVVLFGGRSGSTVLGDTWTFARGDWTQIFPSTPPSARWGSASTFDSGEGVLLLFGGFTGSTYLGDTWEFAGGQWTRLSPSTSPSARFEAGLAYDNATGKALLFGGASCAGATCTADGDTWSYAGGTWSLIVPAPGVQTPGLKYLPYGAPAARQSFGMTYDAANRTVALFGGMVDGDPLGNVGIQSFGPADTWTFTPPTANSTGGWDQVQSESEWDWAQLPGRVGAGFAWDPTVTYCSGGRVCTRQGYAVAFGGSTGYGPNGETWVFLTYPTGAWAEIFPALSPSARSYESMAFDARDNYVVLFGGMSATGTPLGDTWKFQNGNWTELSPKTAPSPRYGAMMTYENTSGGYLLLFGGTNGSAYFSDTWEFQGGQWTPIIDVWGTPIPTARAFGGLSWDNAAGYAVLFGGTTGRAALGDTWKFLDGIWVQIDTGSASPPPEWGMSMVLDTKTSGSAANSVFLFGGCAYATFNPMAPSCPSVDTLGGAWQFNSSWKPISALSRETAVPASPPARFLAASIDDPNAPSNVVLIVGGMASTGLLLTDRWDFQSKIWNPWAPPIEPSARYGSIVDYDYGSLDVLVFGGVGVTPSGKVGYLDDTWLWDPKVWGEANSVFNPSPRAFGAAAYFGLCPAKVKLECQPSAGSLTLNYTVMFGGYGPTGYLGDTWEWKGTPGHGEWTQLYPTTPPPVRANESMVYDAATNQIVMFGGQNAGGYLGDTWVFTTAGQWKELNIAGPSPRASAAMVYDSEGNCAYGTATCGMLHGYVVLFGGKGPSGALADTWEFTGTEWVQLHPTTSPSARYGAGIVDTPRPNNTVPSIAQPQVVMLVAGTDGTHYYNDTWFFVGGEWINATKPYSDLVQVAYAAVQTDIDNGHPLIFGGVNAGGISRQFWEYKLGS
ncbi:MAG: kelch repeat-containing protein [Thermoplasmata archaeon]